MDRRSFAALAASSGVLAAAGGLLPRSALAQSLRLTGAGASFPFPLYSTWIQAYQRGHQASRSTTSPTGAAPA